MPSCAEDSGGVHSNVRVTCLIVVIHKEVVNDRHLGAGYHHLDRLVVEASARCYKPSASDVTL